MTPKEAEYIPRTMLMQTWVEQNRLTEPHTHRNGELLYLLHGELTAVLPEETFTLSSGDILFIQAMYRHSLKTEPGSIYLRLHINYSLAGEFADLSGAIPQIFRKNTQTAKRLQKYLNRVINMTMEPDEEIRMLLQGQYYEILYLLQEILKQQDADGAEDSRQTRRTKITQFILKNYRTPIQLQDLADALGLSRVYTSKYFKQVFGVGFVTYLSDFRLSKAEEDIVEDPDRSFLAVALDNGYPNLSTFNRAFRLRNHMTPSQYRKLHVKDSRQTEEVSADYRKAMQYITVLRSDEKDMFTGKETARIEVPDVHAVQPFAKPWERILNCGRFSALQYEENRIQLLQLVQSCGFTAIRIWYLFEEDLTGNFMKNPDGGKFNFSRVDRAMDFLVENGLHPFLVIMPKPYLLLSQDCRPVLESRSHENDFDWSSFFIYLEALLRHLGNRYHDEKLENWYFEFWYDFRSGVSTGEVLERIRKTAGLIRKYLPGASFGGCGENIDQMQEVMDQAAGYFDFLSIGHFDDEWQKTLGRLVPAGERIEECRKYMDSREDWRGKPLLISEWSFTLSNRNPLNDSCFKAAYLVRSCIDMIGKNVQAAGYWLASDIEAEYDDTKEEIFGGTGLLTRNAICKPACYAFQFLHQLHGNLAAKEENAVITADGAEDVRIVCHNVKNLSYFYLHHEMDAQMQEDRERYFENEEPKKLRFVLGGFLPGRYIIKSRYVNQHVGSIESEWSRIREEDEVTQHDIAYLQNVTVPRIEVENVEVTGTRLELSVVLEPNEIRYIHIRKVL